MTIKLTESRYLNPPEELLNLVDREIYGSNYAVLKQQALRLFCLSDNYMFKTAMLVRHQDDFDFVYEPYKAGYTKVPRWFSMTEATYQKLLKGE